MELLVGPVNGVNTAGTKGRELKSGASVQLVYVERRPDTSTVAIVSFCTFKIDLRTMIAQEKQDFFCRC